MFYFAVLQKFNFYFFSFPFVLLPSQSNKKDFRVLILLFRLFFCLFKTKKKGLLLNESCVFLFYMGWSFSKEEKKV